MGRFSDLWATGKFIRKEQQELAQNRATEAVHLFEQLSPEIAVPEGTKEIFDALKSRRGQETGRWLRTLAPDVPAQAEVAAASMAASVSAFEETVAWVDALFKELGELSYEFNRTAFGTNLLISTVPPQLSEKKSDELWYKPVTKTYQGRLTTRQFSLIVRGRDNHIAVFMMPASLLLAFSGDDIEEEKCSPFMEIARSAEGIWAIGGETVSISVVPHLAKVLLGDLIRLSSGTMTESELFSVQADPPKLGENLAVGYKQPAPAATSEPSSHADFDMQNMTFHDACDILDTLVEKELQNLYAQAASIKPGCGSADFVRKKISAVEVFRTKILDAFAEYTRSSSQTPPADLNRSEEIELLH